MTTFIYRVFVPDFISKQIGFATENFEDRSILKARTKALHYLSTVVKFALESNLVKFFDFENDDSKSIHEVKNLSESKYNIDEKLLDFQYLSECKIDYQHSKNDVKEIMKRQFEMRASLSDRLLTLGVFTLLAKEPEGDFIKLFELRNSKKPITNSTEKVFINFNSENPNEEDFKPLLSKNHFIIKSKRRDFAELFTQDNNVEKEILDSVLYMDFEKKFLSICNCQCPVSFFVEKELTSDAHKLFFALTKTYSSKRNFELVKNVMVEGKNFSVFFFGYEPDIKLTYSHDNKLYYRNQTGCTEVSETTTLQDIVNSTNCISKELQEILKFI